MKTYMIYMGSSEGFKPLHTFKAASFMVVDGVYMFYDEEANPLHAIAVAPGMFVNTAVVFTGLAHPKFLMPPLRNFDEPTPSYGN